MRLRGLLAGTATAVVLSGAAGYGIAVARSDDDRGARGNRSAPMHHDMMGMQRQMASGHGRMMRDAEMREMHRRMMRDADMREMHREMVGDPQMREMHEEMGDSGAGSMRGSGPRGG